MTDLTPRIPPFNEGAEISLLGSVLLDNDALYNPVVCQVQTEAFYSAGHQKIWACIPDLREKRGSDGTPGPVALETLAEELMRRGQLEEAGGLTYLMGLAEKTSTAAYAEHFAQIVLEKAHLRAIISKAGHVMRAAYDQQMPLEDLDAFASDFPKLSTIQENTVRAGSVLQTVLDEAANGTGARGASTGLRDLDDFMGGFERKRLYIDAARPAMGKTAMAFQMAAHVAEREGRVLALSLEMPVEELTARLICSEARIDLQRFTDARRGKAQLNDRDWGRIVAAQERIDAMPLDIVKRQDMHLDQLVQFVRREHQREPLHLFLLDYLQLVTVSGRSGNRTQEVSDISRALKNLALELDIPVLALAQLSREVEKRPNKRPMLSDLRESGGIEADADVVMFIYRDEYYNPQTDQQGIAEIILGKQRNGPVGTVKTQYLAAYTRFNDLARDF